MKIRNNVMGNALKRKTKTVDQLVSELQTGRKMPKKKQGKKNPYKRGSARAKAWARKN